jgi:hypothetical protein
MLKQNKLALALLSIISIIPLHNAFTQTRTYSPLSRYGLGDIQNHGFSGVHGMGNTGIGYRSSRGINNLNPASYTAMDSLSFYFEAGISDYWQSFETGGTTGENSNMVFDYITLGFSPSTKVSANFGIRPFSSTGYAYKQISEINENTTATQELVGSGNISQLYLGLAFKPVKHLSVGGNISYLFGNLQNVSKASFNESGDLNYGVKRELHASSILYDFGIQYEYVLSKNRTIIFGATYRPKIGLKGDTLFYAANGYEFGDNTDLFSLNNENKVIKNEQNDFNGNDQEYPGSIGFGVSYSIKNKLTIGGDFNFEAWEDANQLNSKLDVQNTTRYSVGAEFIPNDRAAKNYLNRIHYRIGGYYNNDYQIINNIETYNYGITFGVGLPLRRSKTAINFSLELGQRNANNSFDYKEKYGKVKVNLSLHEFWFAKRQFD